MCANIEVNRGKLTNSNHKKTGVDMIQRIFQKKEYY